MTTIKLPNGISILLGVIVVAVCTALVGELPTAVEGWAGLALAAIVGGIAKAVQVWLDERRASEDMRGVTVLDRPSKAREWLIG